MTELSQSSSLDVPIVVSNEDRRKQIWARVWCGLSLFLVALGVGATRWQLYLLAAFRLVPAWCWLVAGMVPLILARRLRPRCWLVGLTVLWVWFGVTCVDESRSLTRSMWSRISKPMDSEPQGLRLRVVSMNCSDGSLRTARETVPLAPDVLLFQESPGRDDLERLATELFGDSHGVLWSPDTSVVSRWPIQPTKANDHFVVGSVQPPGGPEIRVVSLRLAPPIVRYDFWSPTCWREQIANREHQSKQVEPLANTLIDDSNFIIILGGDFNAPQHDHATRVLRNFGRDTFDVAGRGWGNTVLNTIPVLRFDQIWASGHFRPIATWAVRSEHSDHRLVVSDLVLLSKWRERGRRSVP